jgi:hypothetical protein
MGVWYEAASQALPAVEPGRVAACLCSVAALPVGAGAPAAAWLTDALAILAAARTAFGEGSGPLRRCWGNYGAHHTQRSSARRGCGWVVLVLVLLLLLLLLVLLSHLPWPSGGPLPVPQSNHRRCGGLGASPAGAGLHRAARLP